MSDTTTNTKETPEKEEKTEMTKEEKYAAIKSQIEFYFSDSNMPTDAFMKEQAKANAGFIPITTLLKFNKLKQLTDSPEVIINALKSAPSDIVKLNDNGTKIGRVQPLPEDDPTVDRSIYVKGLSCEDNKVTTENVKAIFEKKGLDAVAVWLRRYFNGEKKGQFKGTAYIEFKTEDMAKKAIELKLPGPNDEKLEYMTKKAHYEEKQQQAKERGERKKRAREPVFEMKKDTVIAVRDVGDYMPRFSEIKQGIQTMTKKKPLFVEVYNGNLMIRFSEPEDAKAVLRSISVKQLKLDEYFVDKKTELVQGEEEDKYWEEKVLPALKSSAKKRKFGGFGRKGGKKKQKV